MQRAGETKALRGRPAALAECRPRLGYANIASTLALVIALGGASAIAAGQLGYRSVGERQLRPGAVTADKIRKGAVSAPKIKPLAVKVGKLAGGAVSGAKLAAGAVSAEKIAEGAITAPKLADGAINGQKVDESSLTQVPSAAHADSATSAESAHPAAFAYVAADGTVDPSLAKSLSSANVKAGLSPGIYCITVPAFTPRGAQVTPRYNGAGDINALLTIGSTSSCAAPAVEVQTFKGAALLPSPFYVSLYR